jgi:hypothetical protein
MFTQKSYNYLIGFGVIVVVSYLGSRYKHTFDTNDEYELIKKYLLNDSPLYGFNKPKLWIHTKYEINARKWKSFYSRNTTDLNQPYIHLTIKTIINHCGEDFNICLIDDETFSKLIPSWDIDLKTVAEPMKSHLRELGMLQLIYYYGGMTIPNSFICLRNLKNLYDEGTIGNKCFVTENINHSVNIQKQPHKMLFTPDTYIMGAKKNNSVILECIEYLKQRNSSHHFSSESNILGNTSMWCLYKIQDYHMNLIGGELVGVKTHKRKPIVLDDLMEENFLDVLPNIYGVYIPADEILSRTKYQWFAVLSSEEILKTNAIISKYLMASIVDSSDEYKKTTEIRSVISI